MRDLVKNTTVKYTLIGVLFGLAFPLVAFGLELFRLDTLSPLTVLRSDSAALLCIIMLAPFVLGATFSLIGRKHAGLKSNLTLTRSAEQRNRELANLDHLTRHGNRRAFIEAVKVRPAEAAARGHEAFLCLVDLDNFKFVNDTLGHNAGDALLVELSARLSRAIGDSGRFYRLGGDEFAAIVECDRDEIGMIAERMLAVFDMPVDLNRTGVMAGGSIGIVRMSKEPSDEGEALLHADLALRKAKDIFGNAYCFFEQAMADEANLRLALEKDLQSALAEGDEISFVLQPIVDARTMRTDGFEALARWNHPRLGDIPPGSFIPVAEVSGQILPLGELILRRACAAAAAWELPLSLSINVSPEQFKDRRFYEVVQQSLADAGLAANRLILEITESVFIHDIGLVGNTFRRLKALGVRFALDDFGTGFSSINHLRNLDLDTLKLDRSFVERAVGNHRECEIIRKIVELGRAFDLTITAEGVETGPQLDLLHTIGVEHLQGFFFAQPVSPEEAGRMIREMRTADTGNDPDLSEARAASG